jgi:pimeloyl-ACP methyl ester carboxylesterase
MEKNLVYKTAQVRIKSQGQGNAVVLLHGFLESLDIWSSLQDVLSQGNRVLSIDLLGHGKTGVLSDVHTMEDNAEMVKFVLESEGVKDCVCIGHSMGGYVTLALADLYPSLLRGFGLFHSSAFADTEEKKEERKRSAEIALKDHRHYVNELIPKLFFPGNAHKFAKEIESVRQIGLSTQPSGIAAALRGMALRRDRTDILKSAAVPVKFIFGKEDPVLPFEKVFMLAGLPAVSQATVLAGCGHMGYIEAFKECRYGLQGFLQLCFS